MTSATSSPDYGSLIDAQTREFIQRTEAAFPDYAAELPIANQRALYDAMCKQFHRGYPAGVTSYDSVVAAGLSRQIPIRQYTSDKTPARVNGSQLVYLHGGGFVVGSLDSHDDVCAEISDLTGRMLTSVDYGLSPENRHPVALNDVLLVLQSLWSTYQLPLLICGDSAGANLAAAASHACRNRRASGDLSTALISGQVLIYPGLGGDMTRGSYIDHANPPMLSTEDVRYFATMNAASEADYTKPLFAPLQDSDFSDLPPTVAFSAEYDPLADDGRHYCEKIVEANGQAHWVNEPRLVHGYLRARGSVKRAADSFSRIISAISALADNRWPY